MYVKRGFLMALRHYFFVRLDAFNGLIFCLVPFVFSILTWVAKLQWFVFHFSEGSGQALQYQPDSISVARPQPSHCSTIL
jgi:hypothetical protein